MTRKEKREKIRLAAWTAAFITGFVLMVATESDWAISNIIGLVMFLASGLKLGLFASDESEFWKN